MLWKALSFSFSQIQKFPKSKAMWNFGIFPIKITPKNHVKFQYTFDEIKYESHIAKLMASIVTLAKVITNNFGIVMHLQ